MAEVNAVFCLFRAKKWNLVPFQWKLTIFEIVFSHFTTTVLTSKSKAQNTITQQHKPSRTGTCLLKICTVQWEQRFIICMIAIASIYFMMSQTAALQYWNIQNIWIWTLCHYNKVNSKYLQTFILGGLLFSNSILPNKSIYLSSPIPSLLLCIKQNRRASRRLRIVKCIQITLYVCSVVSKLATTIGLFKCRGTLSLYYVRFIIL